MVGVKILRRGEGALGVCAFSEAPCSSALSEGAAASPGIADFRNTALIGLFNGLEVAGRILRIGQVAGGFRQAAGLGHLLADPLTFSVVCKGQRFGRPVARNGCFYKPVFYVSGVVFQDINNLDQLRTHVRVPEIPINIISYL